jgi:hypothetical protein
MEYDDVGHSATFIRPEDIVVAKLVAHRETQSDKHLRDARGVLVTLGRAESGSNTPQRSRGRNTWPLEELIRTVQREIGDNDIDTF